MPAKDLKKELDKGERRLRSDLIEDYKLQMNTEPTKRHLDRLATLVRTKSQVVHDENEVLRIYVGARAPGGPRVFAAASWVV